MENNYDEIDFSGPPVNPAIRHLWNLENTGYAFHKRACQSYSQWLVNYDEPQIAAFFKVSVEEIKADLAYIHALLPEEAIALHIRERDEIRASRERSKRVHEELAADLSLPAKTLIERGKNPADVMRRYREAVEYEVPPDLISDLRKQDSNIRNNGNKCETTEVPGQIKELRRQSNQSNINESADDLSPEASYRLIKELREEGKKPERKDTTISRPFRESQSAPPKQKQNMQTTNSLVQKSVVDRPDRRVTFRLNPDLHDKLHRYSKDAGIDISTAVRTALSQFLDSDASKVATNAEMPQEALSLTGPFQTWGSDLREELRLRFLKLLAMSYITRKRWHRADWIRELHAGLLSLYKCLEVNDSVGQFKE